MAVEYIWNLEQGTEEWLEKRLGIVTASVVKNLLTKKFAISKDQKSKLFAFDIASQRITKRIEPIFQTYDMERGHIEEELARDLYEKNYHKVKECGFIKNNKLGFTVGFSPDGLVDDDGIIEIKSRRAKYQVQTFVNNEVPDEYMAQCQMGMLMSEREWCDFIQYSNGMPLFVKRVYPIPEIVDAIKTSIIDFEGIIQEMVRTFHSHSEGFPVADYVQHVLEDSIEV